MDSCERWMREDYEISKRLDCTNIAAVESYTQIEGLGNVIVAEYVAGRTLSDYMKEGFHPYEEKRDIAIQIARALAHAHDRGVLHRELTPENIVITERSNSVKVLNFSSHRTFTNIELGEVGAATRYDAPELLEGGVVDQRADIYSWGMIVGELFKGDLNQRFRRVLARSTRHNAASRYATPQRVVTAIRRRSSWSYAVAALLIAIIGFVVYDYADPVTTIEDENYYANLRDEYYAYHIKFANNSATSGIIDPLARIPDFATDSVAFIKADLARIDSLFAKPRDRKSRCYDELMEQNYAATSFAMYHELYVERFFDAAEVLFSKAKDRYARELRHKSPEIIQPSAAKGAAAADVADRAAAKHIWWCSLCDYHKATALKYVIYMRQLKDLEPLTEEFLLFYDMQK